MDTRLRTELVNKFLKAFKGILKKQAVLSARVTLALICSIAALTLSVFAIFEAFK